MISFKLDVDEKDWWVLAGHAERDGLKTSDLLTRLMHQAIRMELGGKNFDLMVEKLWGEGFTDSEMCVQLSASRDRVSASRRRLGFEPNK